ncbi:MAG: hypothetical protein RSF40_09910 [Oscillospiraceae bacterium]
MKSKLVCFVLTSIMVITLSGCQLAKEDLSQVKGQDRLIGVYVTYEHLDLFDMESYLNDNINKLSKGGNIEIKGDTNKYNNRLYATLLQEEVTATGGEKYKVSQYVFENLQGISMFSPTITDPITGNTYISSDSSMGIADLKSHYNSDDNEEGITLEGTIYVASGAMSDAIYINPVYQSEDESVYLQAGQGFSATGDNGEGDVYTQTLSDSTSIKENKTTTTYSTSIKLSIKTINPTEKVSIYQMDSKNNIISKNEYRPENVPQEIMPENFCEYFIVENHKKTFNGENQVDRQLFSKIEDGIYYFTKGNNGVLNKTYSTILWETK